MKRALLFLLLTFPFAFAQAQPNPQYQLALQGTIQSKNYYLLTLMQQNAAVKALLENDAELSQLFKQKLTDLNNALANCKDAGCYTTPIKFTDSEIKAIGNRLLKLYTKNNALGKMVNEQLIPSGAYVLYASLSPDQLLVKAWEQDATGLNYAIAVYAEGKKPRYAAIDSISFDVKNKLYPTLMYNALATVLDGSKHTRLFFEPTLTAALIFMDINGRRDPANDEPMATTVNQAAIAKAKTVNWAKYKYSLIMIPGAGPEEAGVELSAEGMLRCRLGANRYFEGMAPFIMVSGGKVHPYKTKYCEADEMRKYLVNVLHVPASAVITEPHARHTTTNLRNGVRLIFRYGLPFSKPFVTCTDKSQSYYITNMGDRCMKELKYMPYRLGIRLSDTEQECYPLIESLQINPLEPLDP